VRSFFTDPADVPDWLLVPELADAIEGAEESPSAVPTALAATVAAVGRVLASLPAESADLAEPPASSPRQRTQPT